MEGITAPRGIRLCNPTLLRKSPTPWLGKVPGPDPDFESFAYLEAGVRAGARNALTHWHRGARTVRRLITLQAPAIENRTADYVAFVAAALGVGPDSEIDLDDLRILESYTDAVCRFECADWPIPIQDLRLGCARALFHPPVTGVPS